MASIEASSASQIQMDYMKLLVSQLQNQNPLEPMDNNQMASQLAQFSQLSQLEGMNSSFAEVLSTTNRNYANSLMGKNVAFYIENEISGEAELKKGSVESVFYELEKNMLTRFYDIDEKQSLLGVKDSDGQEYTLGLEGVVLVENQ